MLNAPPALSARDLDAWAGNAATASRSAGLDYAAGRDADLVAGFYAAAAHEDDWNEPWSALCTAFSADTGLLYRQSRPAASPHILAALNWPSVASTAITVDPAWLRASTLDGTPPAAGRARDTGGAPSDRHVLSARIPLDGTALIGMGLHRTTGAPAFTQADRDALDGLGRHVASALRLEAMLDAARGASAIRAASLDLLPHGVIICTGAGTLVFANLAARSLAQASTLVLGAGRACLAGLAGAEAEKLERLITSVAGGRPGGCVRVSRGPGQAPLAAIVEPLPLGIADDLAKGGRALVQVSLRDLGATSDAAAEHLMDLFGLTAAEAGIVPQLIAGDSVSLIAQSRGVAISTVKAQNAKILAKTGAANLRALAAMIATIS